MERRLDQPAVGVWSFLEKCLLETAAESCCRRLRGSFKGALKRALKSVQTWCLGDAQGTPSTFAGGALPWLAQRASSFSDVPTFCLSRYACQVVFVRGGIRELRSAQTEHTGEMSETALGPLNLGRCTPRLDWAHGHETGCFI